MTVDWLLTIDPGKRGCGCAMWYRGVLRAAGYVAPKERATTLAGAVESMARAVEAWALELTRGEIRQGRLVIELPQTYGGRADKGDANTLIALGCVVGAVMGALGCPSHLVVPHGWKKTLPKENSEGVNLVEERSRAALLPSERALVQLPRAKGLTHNVWDGIGIGLHSLGRAFI